MNWAYTMTMETSLELFFELIKVSIGTQESLNRIPLEAEWQELYQMAEEQALLGVCFCGIKKLKEQGIEPPQEVYYQWLAMSTQIWQRNEVVDKRCIEIARMVKEAGFRHFIMKGQGNAVLYGSELGLLRQSGDIDIYLEGGFKKTLSFVKSTFPTKQVNELEIQYNCFADVPVEIHYRPFIIRNPPKNIILQDFFTAEAESCYDNHIDLPNGVGNIPVPTRTFNLVHQLVHIHHHLFTGGIGLRQLMDYYFVLANGGEDERACEIINDLGLIRFAAALMWVIGHVFGLKRNQMLIAPHETDGRFLLGEILRAGNFGHSDKRLTDVNLSRAKRFWIVNTHNMKLLRFSPWEWFWGLSWRVYHFVWRKYYGFE